MTFYQKISNFLLKGFKEEGKKICRECHPFVKKGAKILDIGCGNGVFTKIFQDFFQADIIGIDLQDRRVVDIPFKLVNGESLPFAENQFDVVFMIYLLHHTDDPIKILKEARRVSRDKIIIYEDLRESFIDHLSFLFHKVTYRLFFKPYNLIVNFRSEKEWEEIFNELGLEVVSKKRTPSSVIPFDLRNRNQFVLRKISGT